VDPSTTERVESPASGRWDAKLSLALGVCIGDDGALTIRLRGLAMGFDAVGDGSLDDM
jgi:hypothetical protein